MAFTPSKARPGTTVVSSISASPYVNKVRFQPGIDTSFFIDGLGRLNALVPYGAVSGAVSIYYPGGSYTESIYVIADLPSPKITAITGLSLTLDQPSYYTVSGVQIFIINNAGGVTPGDEIDILGLGNIDLTGYGTTAPNTSLTYKLRYYDGTTTYNGPTTYVAFAPTMVIVGNTATAPSSRPSGIAELRLQKYVSGAWSDHATSVANSQPVDLTSLAAGTPVRWKYLFSSGGQGGSDTFSVSDSVTWIGAPPLPVIDTKTDVAVTLAAITFGAEYDAVVAQIKEVSGAYDAGTTVTTGVDTVLSGLTAATSYLIRYAATIDSDTIYSNEKPVTTFDEGGEGGGESEDAPDAPADLEDTDLTDVSVRLAMDTKPSNATYQGIEIKQAAQDSSYYVASPVHLTAAGNIDFTGLTADTRYTARPYTFNDYGTTYGHVYKFKTERFGSTAVPPVAPAAPTLSSKTPSSAAILQPSWPGGTASMKLYRGDPDAGGLLVHTYATEGEGAFTDTPLVNGSSYSYYAVAHNVAGDSPKSPALVVSLIATNLNVTWVKPDEGADVANRLALIVRMVDSADTDETTPLLRIEMYGSALPGLKRISGNDADGQYRTYLDTSLLDYQGELTFYAIGTNPEGYETAPVPVTVNIDNSIYNGLSWFSFELTATRADAIEAMNQRITRAQVVARPDWLERNFETPGIERFWHVFARSPKGAGLADDVSPSEVLEYAAGMQPAAMSYPGQGRNLELTGDQGDVSSQSDHTLEALFIGYRAQAMLKYATECEALPKLRERGENLFGFGTGPATVFELAKSGLTTVLDLSTRGMGDAIDAARLGDDKIFCLNSTTVRICDLTDGDRDGDFKPVTESKTPIAIEAVGDTVFIAYASGGNSTVWVHDGRDWQIAFNLAETINFTEAFGSKLYFATSAHKLYSYAAGDAAPTLLYTHTADIVAVLLNAGGAVQFADTGGDIYQATSNGAFEVASIAGTNDLGEFQGADIAARGAAAAGNVLYLQGLEGYTPQFTLADADDILSLRRLNSVITEAQGGPLNGGTAAVTDESLWGGVAIEAGEAYWFRLQMAPTAQQSPYRGLNPRRSLIVLKPTGFARNEA